MMSRVAIRSVVSLTALISIYWILNISYQSTQESWNAIPLQTTHPENNGKYCTSEVWAAQGYWDKKPGLSYTPNFYDSYRSRQFNLDEFQQALMPLSTEQQCIVGLGEWEQYCSHIGEDIQRANHLLSWEYVAPGCKMRSMTPESVIASMIHDGGWSILGDSLAREVAYSCNP